MIADASLMLASAGETFGFVLRTRRAGPFLLRESRYGPGLSMPLHRHARGYLSFVVRGGARERSAAGEHAYAAGSLHAHPPGDPHAARAGAAGLTVLSIVLAGELPGLAPRTLPGGPARPDLALLAARCHRELLERDAMSDLALEGLALELVAALVRSRTPRERATPAWLLAVRDRLEARPAEAVSLADLAALAGVHPVHLVRAFRRRFGTTPAAYQRSLRVERARRALIESDAPIADLALAAGFSSQAHFTRLFRLHVGATPAEYRRAHARSSR